MATNAERRRLERTMRRVPTGRDGEEKQGDFASFLALANETADESLTCPRRIVPQNECEAERLPTPCPALH
jgi:hypothetical protein